MHTINPNLLAEDSIENKLLYHFLAENKPKNYFKKNVPYDIKIKNKVYSFKLTHDLLVRPRESDPSQLRYEILEDVAIAKGAYGEIKRIAGTLMPTPDKRFRYKKTPRRVNKSQYFRASNSAAYHRYIKLESDYLKSVNPRIGSKTPIFVGDEYGHIPMHLLEGKTLAEKLKDQEIKTVDEMLKIGIALIKAYQEDVHDKGLIHCDGKPANVFIESSGKITIIDFGLTVKEGEFRAGGTPLYTGYKRIGKLADDLDDMYSIIIMLRQIWKHCSFLGTPLHGSNSFEALGITPKHKTAIEQIFKDIDYDPKMPSRNKMQSDDVLEIFEQMRIDLKASKKSIDKGLFNQAHQAGVKARKAYRKYIKNVNNFKNPAPDCLQNIIFTGLSEIDKLVAVNSSKSAIEAVLVEEFIDTLNIQAFVGLSTTANMRKKYESMNAEYENNLQNLIALQVDINNLKYSDEKLKVHIEFLQSEIERVINKQNKFNIANVDCLNQLNAKFKQYVPHFEAEIKRLKRMDEVIITLKSDGFVIRKNNFAQFKKSILLHLNTLPDESLIIKMFAKKVALIPGFQGLKNIRNKSKFLAAFSEIEGKITYSKKSENAFAKMMAGEKKKIATSIESARNKAAKIAELHYSKKCVDELCNAVRALSESAPADISAFTTVLSNINPVRFKDFKNIDQYETLKCAADEFQKQFNARQLDAVIVNVNDVLKNSSCSFAETKQFMVDTINQLDESAVKDFVSKINPPVFGTSATTKTELKQKLENISQRATEMNSLFYQAAQRVQLAAQLHHNNLFASRLFKSIQDKQVRVATYKTGIAISKERTDFSLDNLSFAEIYAITTDQEKQNLDGLKYFIKNLQYHGPKELSSERILITHVLDELVKAPKNLQNDDLVTTAENFKSGIIKYINETYNSSNFLLRGRAASDKRLADMHKILVIINTASSAEELVKKVEAQLGDIKTGFFKRSLLIDIMRDRIADYYYPQKLVVSAA